MIIVDAHKKHIYGNNNKLAIQIILFLKSTTTRLWTFAASRLFCKDGTYIYIIYTKLITDIFSQSIKTDSAPVTVKSPDTKENKGSQNWNEARKRPHSQTDMKAK